MIMVYITAPSQEAAKAITRQLLEKRLVACATMWPCASMYWWNGAIHDDAEYIVLAKTILELWESVQTMVKEIHPYEVPCITKIDASANDAYMQWVRQSVTAP
jgi:periplasmic divalent cation tolerance protein